MPTPLFADMAQQVGNTIIQALAVAGAAAVGYFVTRGLVWLICRATIHKQPPKQLSHIIGALAAAALGLAAFFFLFMGEGGGGWGFGPGGGWFGTGSGGASVGVTTTTTQTKFESPPIPLPPMPKSPQTSPKAQLAIRMLGGDDVKEERFYRVEGQERALTLAEVQKLIRDRKNAAKDKIQEIVILVYRDSVSRDHEKVLALKNFGINEGLLVSIPENPEKR